MKYKIAIIDDEMYGDINRKDFYDKLFGNEYDIVKYISRPQEIDDAPYANVHAYVIDLIYEGEASGYTFDGIIENINEEKRVPIILVTNKWETFKEPNVVGKICKFSNIVMCIDWESITAPDTPRADYIIKLMRREIGQFYRHTSLAKGDNDNITILHLSDLQFGDRNTDPKAFFAQYDIATFLKDIKKTPDILVISGDIASHGIMSEYNEAYTWLKDFSARLWEKKANWDERVVIVPGNHDVDYSQFIPDMYEWDVENEDFNISFPTKQKSKPTNEYGSKAMLDFSRFMRKVSGDYLYLDEYESLFRVNERFINWGIRFYEMNTARDVSPMTPKKVHVHSEDYQKLKRDTVSIDNTKVFNIIVSHYGPDSLGCYSNNDIEKQNEWDRMQSFIESSKCHMMCAGHIHRSEIKKLDDHKNGALFARNLVVSIASTSLLSSYAMPSGEQRGFNVLELERTDGVVSNVKGYEFKFEGSRIVIPKKEFVFEQKIAYSYD